MNIYPLGKITVTTAGTPVQIITAAALQALTGGVDCTKILVQPLDTNTGKVYVGNSTLVSSTYVGCIRSFLKPSTTFGQLDFWYLENQSGAGNPLSPATLYLDVSVSGEGALVTLYVE